MTQFIALWMLLLCGVCVYRIWADTTRGRYDLVCLRNIFLLGFMIFQLVSAALTLFTGNYLPYPLRNPEIVGLYYAVLATLFLVVFLVTYNHPLKANRLIRFVPRTAGVPTGGKLLILVVLATVTAVGLKYGLRIPLIGILATYVGNAMGAAAAVIIGWYWAPRFLNPAVAIPSLALLLVNAAVAVQGSSSRRDIIAVFAGFIWGVYFSRVRFMRMRSYLPTLGVVSAIGIVVVASFTSVRGSGADRDRSPMEHLQAMLTGTDLVAGLYDLGSGQQAAGISMWIIDNHPETYPFRGPATLKYIYEIPIPRMMWPEKPNPLSIEIPKMARIRGVGYGEYNVGPGVVGQSYSDFGPAAVLLYAILLGIMIRFADDLVWRSPRDIFVIAAVGSGLGQILAIPRGDVSLFTFVFLVGFAGCYVCMLVFAKILRLEAGPAAVSQAGQAEVLDGMTGSDAEFQPTPATPTSDGYRNYAELGPA
ncbi:MAG: O-antigen polymerase [Phycisphaerales bacterium]